MDRNSVYNNGYEIPELSVLVKDHKDWSFDSGKIIPTRPILNGNNCINTHLSELISELVEPLVLNQDGAEINSTEEFLSKVDQLNEQILKTANFQSETVLDGFTSYWKTTQLDDARTVPDLKSTNENCIISGAENDSQDELLEEEAKIASGILAELIEDEKANETPYTQTKIESFFKSTDEGKNNCSKEVKEYWSKYEDARRGNFENKYGTINERIFNGLKAAQFWEKDFKQKNESFGSNNIQCKNNDESVTKPPLQDFNSEPLLLGADVISLYPSLDGIAVAKLTGNAVRKTKVAFSGINYLFLCVYLYQIICGDEMRKLGLGKCVPKKKEKKDEGVKSLAATLNRETENWDFDGVIFTEWSKREMIAIMVEISVLVLVSTTCYSFGGRIFRQRKGLGIGLRASACLARLVMCNWDAVWGHMQHKFGLKLQLFCRYVDDLRFYIYPINKGWKWYDQGWKYEHNYEDEYCPTEYTQTELGKSLDCVWKFLKFTLENEKDFTHGYLPTLDCQTKVCPSGIITYKYFSKPMASNIVLQNGTALSRNCVFSSLRQDLVRRMNTTSVLEDTVVRVEVVKDYIQLLVNSDHKYAFIKAVIQQGLSKFEYMKYRSNLEKEHKLYEPLHRSRCYNYEKRKISKYMTEVTWFQNKSEADPYKDLWKGSIKRKETIKSGTRRKNEHCQKKYNITSVMFVPPTVDGTLLKLLQDCENKIRQDVGWGIKLIEKPGSPLAMQFIKKEPMVLGCPLGKKCIVCNDQGVKCSTKRVVYVGECQRCKEVLDNLDKPGTDSGKLNEAERMEVDNMKELYSKCTYIGETSRVLRSRVMEHINAVESLDKDSFIIEHWQSTHGTEIDPPRFKFDVISTHRDCLSRQLREAILIRERGRLNRKKEYSNNELIKMEVNTYSWEQDRQTTEEGTEKRCMKQKIEQFINCIRNVRLLEETRCKKLNSYCYRLKRSRTVPDLGLTKRARMDTSTPVQCRREAKLLELSESSVEGQENSELSMQGQENSNQSLDYEAKTYGASIQVTDEVAPAMMKLKITPKKIEPTLLRLVKQTIAASEYFESLEFRQETISKRTRTTSFIHRSKFVGKEISGALNKSGSMDELLKSIAWEDWKKNEKWKKFDSDSSSMEYSDGGNVGINAYW